jgi:hypothetical protein
MEQLHFGSSALFTAEPPGREDSVLETKAQGLESPLPRPHDRLRKQPTRRHAFTQSRLRRRVPPRPPVTGAGRCRPTDHRWQAGPLRGRRYREVARGPEHVGRPQVPVPPKSFHLLLTLRFGPRGHC